MFIAEKSSERDEEGNLVSEHIEFHLNGIKDRKWMLLPILDGIRELAGSFEEEIYTSDNCKVYVRTYSEATEELEKPRTKAIYIEDYSCGLPRVVVVFPYQQISDEEMIKAIDSSERLQHEAFSCAQDKKRPSVPQSTRVKALVRSKGKCENCGESLSGVTPHVHHKDGNPKNNRLSNLKVLCPNCHSSTQTYKKSKSKKHID